ncbi:5910_t:CDS:1, partial [Ambispora leptoticha]
SESDSREDEEEYEEEKLINKIYLYWKFREFKERHNNKECVLKKNRSKLKTFYLSKKKGIKDFNLGTLTVEQEKQIMA